METEFTQGAEGGRLVRDCKIRITSRHYVHDIERFAKYGITPSLFDGSAPSPTGTETVDPEDFPDEMNDALGEILRLEHEKYGTPDYIIDPFSPEESEDDGDDCEEYDDCEEDGITSIEELNRKIEALMRLLAPDEDDGDALIFETTGTVEKCVRDGRTVIELHYTEGDSMDGTDTVIRFDPRRPDSAVIDHTGGVVSTLVCEEGVRHITVYKTPVMPFELAVYTKKCRGMFTPYGGRLELDYLLELRGADLQRTSMTIEARAY